MSGSSSTRSARPSGRTTTLRRPTGGCFFAARCLAGCFGLLRASPGGVRDAVVEMPRAAPPSGPDPEHATARTTNTLRVISRVAIGMRVIKVRCPPVVLGSREANAADDRIAEQTAVQKARIRPGSDVCHESGIAAPVSGVRCAVPKESICYEDECSCWYSQGRRRSAGTAHIGMTSTWSRAFSRTCTTGKTLVYRLLLYRAVLRYFCLYWAVLT
eukprot:178318-Rhodomonas_salina.1